MGFIFKGILAVIWLLVVPCLAGGFYFRREKRTCGEYLLAGYTLLFAITELLSLTMIFTKQPLHVLTVTYGVVAGVLAFLGARSLYKKRQKNRISPELVVAGILILIQLIVVVLYAHMDEDDAFYVGTATTAVETDSLYAYNPYTGAAYNVLPSRYILSPFPAFLAVTSRLCGGLHPAIVAHTVFPAVFVFLAYVVLFQYSRIFAAGQTPDVYICNPGPNMDVYVNAGAAADLTDILENQEADWYASFTDGIFERMTYDGKIMAVPTNFAAACVYYNTEMFADAGVEVPTTYDELIAACQKLQDAGYTPISCSAGTAWCLSMIAGYLCDRQGVDLAAIADHTANWTDENCIEAGTKLKDLSQYFQATAAGDSNDQATAAFYNGEAAMLVQGSWAIAQINGNNPDFESKCGVFQFPGIDGANDPNRMIVKTDNLLMSSTTEHQDAAIALMKMFTDETAQKYTAEIGGKFPIIKDLEIDYDKAPAQLKYVQDIMAKATGTFGFYNESLASVEAGDCFDNAMVDIFLGNQTPEEAFQTVQTFYEENVWE